MHKQLAHTSSDLVCLMHAMLQQELFCFLFSGQLQLGGGIARHADRRPLGGAPLPLDGLFRTELEEEELFLRVGGGQ